MGYILTTDGLYIKDKTRPSDAISNKVHRTVHSEKSHTKTPHNASTQNENNVTVTSIPRLAQELSLPTHGRNVKNARVDNIRL